MRDRRNVYAEVKTKRRDFVALRADKFVWLVFARFEKMSQALTTNKLIAMIYEGLLQRFPSSH